MEYKFRFANAVWVVNMYKCVLTIVNGHHTSTHTGVTTWSLNHDDFSLRVQFNTGYSLGQFWGTDGDYVSIEARMCMNDDKNIETEQMNGDFW